MRPALNQVRRISLCENIRRMARGVEPPSFPPEALTFLRALKRNNRREWFHPRKDLFEAHVRQPMERVVEAVNAELQKFAPQHVNEPKKAIYRIYRDTRFSPDKTPYKDHVAAVFPKRGTAKHASAGFYFALSLNGITIAGGAYTPGPDDLTAIRTWLGEHYAEFLASARIPERLMGKLQGSSLQRMPKGFDAGHPAGDLLKKKQWLYYTNLDVELATSPLLVAEITKRFRVMAPIIQLLNAPLQPARTRAAAFVER